MSTPPRNDHLGDRLSGLLDGELPPDEEAEARHHLAACAACRAEMDEVGAARSWVRALPAVDPPFGFYERLLGTGSAQPGPAPRRRVGRGLAALAATAAVGLAVVTVASPQNEPVTPSVNQLVEAHTTAGVTSDPVTQLVSVGVPATFAP
ncbi:MAG: anti-sigma factor [Actinomycetota bacterium]|nr:anti-sigma factor [Actinomycetota bacterium]